MDILFLIKNSHEKLRESSQNLLKAQHVDSESYDSTLKKWLIEVSEFLEVQQEFLLPELSVLLRDAERVLICQEDFQSKLANKISAFNKTNSEDVDELVSVLDFVLANQVDELMPRMREQILTGEREELGLAYEEFVEESQALSEQKMIAGG